MAKESNANVELYTDGACSGNPGPGGWGAILRYKDVEKELSGSEEMTTNNRMELMAVIVGLESLKRKCRVDIYTDSTYVQKGITEWLDGWKKRNWKNAAKKPVKNADLWQRLDEINSRHETKWHWVKGHAGHAENERADKLATLAIKQFKDANKDMPKDDAAALFIKQAEQNL